MMKGEKRVKLHAWHTEEMTNEQPHHSISIILTQRLYMCTPLSSPPILRAVYQ